MNEEEYYAVPTVPVDYTLHGNGNPPYCYDSECSCHEDPILISETNQGYQEGEITADEATDLVNGKHI